MCVCVTFLTIFNCVTKQQRMVTSWTIITFKVVRHETYYFEVCDIITSQTSTRKTVACTLGNVMEISLSILSLFIF